MQPKRITSTNELKSAVSGLEPKLRKPETEETWDTILKSISALSEISKNGACEHPHDFAQQIRSLSSPLISSILSERTRLSGTAVDFVTTVATGLASAFEPLISAFLPPLLSLCGRTNKVFASRAKACIIIIIETTQLPSILPHFLQHIKDKSSSIRLASAEGALACLNCLNPPDLEKDPRIRDIEAVIKSTATDTQADIRRVGKRLFEAYKVLFPLRITSFTDPLTPTIKKYLDIKTADSKVHETLPRLEAECRKALSSSTSSAIGRGRPPSQRPHVHMRSTSTSAVSDSTKHDQEGVVGPKKSCSDMPPPPFIPIRAARSHMDLSRVKPEKQIKLSQPSSVIPQASSSEHLRQKVSKGLPQRVLVTGLTRADVGGKSNRASSDSQRSTAQRLRPQPPINSTSESQGGRSGNGTAPSRTLPPKISSHVMNKSTKFATLKASKGEKSAPASGSNAKAVTKPALAKALRAAEPAKTRPGPQKSDIRVPPHRVQSRPVSKEVSPTEIPLPASPGPSHQPLQEDETLERKQEGGAEELLKLQPCQDPIDAGHPCSTSSHSFNPRRPEQVQEKPYKKKHATDISRAEQDADDGSVSALPPKTPVPRVPGFEGREWSSETTPISALLDSIQRGFILSPSSPLSPPQTYVDSRLSAVKGPFIFMKENDGERLALNSVENIVDTDF